MGLALFGFMNLIQERIKDDAVVVQVAFNVPFSGPNGIGGVTVQGSVSGYKIQTDKKGTTQVGGQDMASMYCPMNHVPHIFRFRTHIPDM